MNTGDPKFQVGDEVENFRGAYLGKVRSRHRGRLGTWKYAIEGKPGLTNEEALAPAREG